MNDERAKQHFDLLNEQRKNIEAELGYALEWQRLEERKASRIAKYRDGMIDNDDQRQELIEWLYGKAVEFHQVFSPRIQALEVE